MNQNVQAIIALTVCIFGAGFIGGHVAATMPATVVVNCNNASANDGGDTPERDLTPLEWETHCAAPVTE